MEIFPLADRKEFIGEIAKLHHTEWKHLTPSLTLENRVKAISNAAGRDGIPSCFIATSGNQFVGSAALVEKDLDLRADLSPWLAAVYVKECFRNQGFATALITRCEIEAAHSGVQVLYLSTEFASKLYEKLGWQILECLEYKGVVVNVMFKQIHS